MQLGSTILKENTPIREALIQMDGEEQKVVLQASNYASTRDLKKLSLGKIYWSSEEKQSYVSVKGEVGGVLLPKE